MITREQIEEIQAESLEKVISIKHVLQEKGIPAHQYFWWKRKYSRSDIPGGFLPIAGGGLPAGMSATCKAHGLDERTWLEDILRRIPEYELGKKDYADLLPGHWTVTHATDTK